MNRNDEVRSQSIGIVLAAILMMVCAGLVVSAEPAPVRLIAKAKKIPNWTLDRNGAVQEVIEQPVQSDEPEESITMIPMGAARLRISALPVIGDGPNAKPWPGMPK